MEARQRTSWTAITVSFALALALMAVPLPGWLLPFRPDLVALLVIFWSCAAPDKVGVGTGWLVGLLLDALQYTLLGQNALTKCLLAFIGGRIAGSMKGYTAWQQALVVLALLSLDIAVNMLIRGAFALSTGGAWHWVGAVTGVLVWPLLGLMLRAPRRHPALR